MPVITYQTASGMTVVDAEYLSAGEEAALLADALPGARAGLAKGFAVMRMRQARLNAAATGAQRAIGWGDHFAVRWDPATQPRALPGGPVTIYGRVVTRAQFRAAERAAGASDTEAGAALARADAAYRDGWRNVRAWSQIDPAGDTGDQHVGLMIPISAAQFRAARAAGWPADIPQ